MYLRIINIAGQGHRLVRETLFNLVFLALDVALILGLDLHLFDNFGDCDPITRPRQGEQGSVADFRPAQQIEQPVFAFHRLPQHTHRIRLRQLARIDPCTFQALGFKAHGVTLAIECVPAQVVYQAQLTADFGQAYIGVVLAQGQTVFGTTGKHPVGFGDAARNQVVHEYPEISLIPSWRPCRQLLCAACRIDSRQQPLRRSFFVARRAVDLPGEKKPRHRLGFQAVLEIARIEIVVFDGIAGARDMGVLEPADGAHQSQLNIKRQTGRDPLRIDLMSIEAFRLEKNLVAILAGKSVDLVLDRWTVARPDTRDDTGKHRRPIQPRTNDVVGSAIGLRDPARQLPRMLFAPAHEREHRHRIISRLRLEH